MPHDGEFVPLTATGRRRPNWLRFWLTVTALAAGAILFWFELFLALAVLLASAAALLPLWAWRLFRANRRPHGPVTIEGEYRIITPSAVAGGDGAQDKPRV